MKRNARRGIWSKRSRIINYADEQSTEAWSIKREASLGSLDSLEKKGRKRKFLEHSRREQSYQKERALSHARAMRKRRIASRLPVCTIIRATVRGYLTYLHNFAGDADDTVVRTSANSETLDAPNNFRNFHAWIRAPPFPTRNFLTVTFKGFSVATFLSKAEVENFRPTRVRFRFGSCTAIRCLLRSFLQRYSAYSTYSRHPFNIPEATGYLLNPLIKR